MKHFKKWLSLGQMSKDRSSLCPFESTVLARDTFVPRPEGSEEDDEASDTYSRVCRNKERPVVSERSED